MSSNYSAIPDGDGFAVGSRADEEQAARRADDALFVQFYVHPLKDETASEQEGRPIYRDTEFVRVIVPGQRDNVIERPVDDFDKRRFAKRYADWKAGRSDEGTVGTPLSEIGFIPRSLVEELAYFKVRTAEQLIAMPDSVRQRLPAAVTHQLTQRVRDFLEAANGQSVSVKLRGELEERDGRIAALEESLKVLQAQMAEQGSKGRR